MSIFPANIDTPSLVNTSNGTNAICKEYAWDFTKNDFLLKDGKFLTVTGDEAVKIWIYKALNTQKYGYMAYSQYYGNELEDLIGKGYSNELIKSEVERYLKDSLLVNNYIKGIQNVSVTQENDKLDIDFTAITVYGEVNISV